MFSRKKTIVSCDTPLGKIAPDEVGGKGLNLYRLWHHGFPVPPWCIVTSIVFRNAVNRQKNNIKKLLEMTDFKNRDSIEAASLQIREYLLNAAVPVEMSEEIIRRLDNLGKNGSLLSVRSSVIGEDSSEHSFAGQMDSFLNVQQKDILETVKKVWASAYSVRALVYRKKLNLSLSNVSAAVIVQKMIQSETSGILFTRNPDDHAMQYVITAGYGLGEGVVSNQVETDTYRIDQNMNELSRQVGLKESRFVCDDPTLGGNRKESVSRTMQTKQVLRDEQIRELCAIGSKAEKLLGSPQDIEWAFDAAGSISILQARPITFSRDTAQSSSLRVWDNSNIVESYPGITLPLTFTFVRTAYEFAFRKNALGFFLISSH